MSGFFETLSGAVEGSASAAIPAAFLWGVLSIVLSPCHLASIPLVVAFISKQGPASGGRALRISLTFSVGILITIGAIGGITAVLGRMLGDVGPAVSYGVAFVFLILGLHFLDVIPFPWSGPGGSGASRKGLLGALVLGLVFGIGVGPCTFAFMAPMLGVTFKVATSDWVYGVALLLAYAVGHCAVIVVAGTSTARAQRWMNWNVDSPAARILRRTCGVLILLGGAYLIYTAA